MSDRCDNIEYMSEGDQLIWLMEDHLTQLRAYMYDPKINRKVFDIYSYMSWALEFFLESLYDCTHHPDVDVIRNLLLVHIEEYNKFIDNSISNHCDHFCAALEIMKHFEIVSREFVH